MSLHTAVQQPARHCDEIAPAGHWHLPALFAALSPPLIALPLGPVVTRALRSFARRRPGPFERLGQYATERYFVDPSDLGLAFSIVPDAARAVVRVIPKGGEEGHGVVIRGPLLALLGLLDGTLDGDALFFNRIIVISGRTEAVLALRNAIEDAELTPAELLGLRGTLGRLADNGVLGALEVARRLVAVQSPIGRRDQ